MFRNHFKIAYRSLLHFKGLSILNIIGLAVGICTSVLLILFVFSELSYDRFFPDRDRIYRVTTKVTSRDGQVLYLPTCLGYTTEEIHKNGFSDVIACRVYRNQISSNYINRWMDPIRYFYADSSFFKVFGFDLLAGNPNSILNEPNTVVITESMARRYFQDEDPMNREIEIYKKFYRVRGLMKDIPFNSHLQFDILISFNSLEPELNVRERSLDFPLYLKVNPTADSKYLSKLTEVIQDMHRNHYYETGIALVSGLQKLTDIHLRSTDLSLTLDHPGDMNDLVILFSLALFIFLLTLSNFINLLTANNKIRIRDMGMRIVLGAQKRQLLGQLISESVLIGLAGAFIAIVLLELYQRPFSYIVGSPISLSFISMAGFFVFFILMAGILGFLSGWIHFVSLIRFSPAQMISGLRVPLKYDRLKVILVIIQFSIIIFLFSVLSVLIVQTRAMKQGDSGFNKNGLYVFHEPSNLIMEDFGSASLDISSLPGVKSVTASLGIPGHNPVVQNVWVEGDVEENAIIITENRVKHNYTETYRFELKEGKFFKWDSLNQGEGFLINESASEALKLKKPIGSVLHVWEHRDTVVGVLKDFHFKSWHNRIEPIVISRDYPAYRYITVRAESDSINVLLREVGDVLGKHLPEYYFIVFPLDKLYDQMYVDEDKNTLLYSGGALLAILIGIFGLVALTTYTTVRKTKEIGIRKALGGSSRNIFILLGGSIMKWILLSALIAGPLAWIAVNDWLDRFYYTIQFPGLLIIASVFMAIAIALVTISWQIFRITQHNPVDSLRYE